MIEKLHDTRMTKIGLAAQMQHATIANPSHALVLAENPIHLSLADKTL